MQSTDVVPRTTAILWAVGAGLAAWLAKTFLQAGVKGAIVAALQPQFDSIDMRIDRLEAERRDQHEANLREFEALRRDIAGVTGRRRFPNHGQLPEENE